MNGFLADCRHGFRLYVRTPMASLIAVLVLAVAMAFVVAFLSLYVDLVLRPHPGFEQSGRVATVGQNMGLQRIGPGVMGLPHELVERLANEMTSIEAAAGVRNTRTLVGSDAEPVAAAMVSAGFFGGLRPRIGLRLTQGRAPEQGETDSVLVNQTLARALWGRDDVVGERLHGGQHWGDAGVEVIGVLRDLSFQHPSAAIPPYVFLTGAHSVPPDILTVIETQMSAAELRRALDRLRFTGQLEAPVRDIRSLETMRRELIPADRARGVLTIALAIVVVALAAFGFYGTQRYLVTAGRREYAVRAALGAGPRALGRLVLLRGLLLGVPGIMLGSLLAFIVVAFLRDDVVSRDIAPGMVTSWVIAGLVVLILIASLAPARQAMHTQPAPLLRED